ncbi:MAG: hypothetical protein JSS65_05395 [Armatimonadetes bacterium]|nr:hypothetical protein [Armatimonadota bacterium]
MLLSLPLVGCGSDTPGATDKMPPKGGPVGNDRHPPGLNDKNAKNYK